MSQDQTGQTHTPILSRTLIQAEALSWIGIRWRHQGRSRTGIDCAGLIIMVSNRLGYPCPDVYGYSRKPDGYDFLKQFTMRYDLKPKEDIKPGDIVLFDDKRLPCHCGIIVEIHKQPYFVHAHALKKKVVFDRLSGVWQDRWSHTLEFRGVPE